MFHVKPPARPEVFGPGGSRTREEPARRAPFVSGRTTPYCVPWGIFAPGTFMRRSMLRTVSRRNRALFALAGLVALAAAGVAEARAGRGGGFGSRGGRTFDAPAQTQTAPNVARPIERSQTTPS